MWKASTLRLKANGNRRRIDRILALVHLKRVAVEISSPAVEGQVYPGHFLLNDLSSTGIGFFSSHSLPEGVEVHVKVKEPYSLEIKGRIQWCAENLTDCHIVSENHHRYRFGVTITHESAEAQAEFEAKIQKIYSEFLGIDQAS